MLARYRTPEGIRLLEQFIRDREPFPQHEHTVTRAKAILATWRKNAGDDRSEGAETPKDDPLKGLTYAHLSVLRNGRLRQKELSDEEREAIFLGLLKICRSKGALISDRLVPSHWRGRAEWNSKSRAYWISQICFHAIYYLASRKDPRAYPLFEELLGSEEHCVAACAARLMIRGKAAVPDVFKVLHWANSEQCTSLLRMLTQYPTPEGVKLLEQFIKDREPLPQHEHTVAQAKGLLAKWLKNIAYEDSEAPKGDGNQP
jgi:hypothetical protein